MGMELAKGGVMLSTSSPKLKSNGIHLTTGSDLHEYHRHHLSHGKSNGHAKSGVSIDSAGGQGVSQPKFTERRNNRIQPSTSVFSWSADFAVQNQIGRDEEKPD